jgi:pimeloyl-ACP methyl ester carboxylesterase
LKLWMTAGLLALAAGAHAQVPDTPEARAALFAYDRGAPLEVKEVGREVRAGGVVVRDVTFAATPGGPSVKAYVVSPPGQGPFAGVLWMHWLGEPATTNRTQFLEEAVALAPRGAVSVLPDAMWASPKWYAQRVPAQDYDSSVRQVVAIRRALDLLAGQPAIDPARLALVGHDYGGMYGMIAAGVEPRLKACAFIATAKSLSDWAFFGPQPVSKAAYLRRNAVLELTDYLRGTTGASTLFQFAEKDIYVARADAAVLLAAAHDRKERRFYDADHAMAVPQAREDRTTWLAAELGLAPAGDQAPTRAAPSGARSRSGRRPC